MERYKEIELPEGHTSWFAIACQIPKHAKCNEEFYVREIKYSGMLNSVELFVHDVRAKAFEELMNDGDLFKTEELRFIEHALHTHPELHTDLIKKVNKMVDRRYQERIDF